MTNDDPLRTASLRHAPEYDLRGDDQLQRSLADRSARPVDPVVFEVCRTPTWDDVGLVRPGTAVLLVSRPDSEDHRSIRASMEAGHWNSVEMQTEAIRQQHLSAFYHASGKGSRKRAEAKAAPGATAIVSVQYASRNVVQGVSPTPTLDIAAAVVLFDGSGANPEAFGAVEHVADPSASPSMVTILITRPPDAKRREEPERETPGGSADDTSTAALTDVDASIARVAWPTLRFSHANAPGTPTYLGTKQIGDDEPEGETLKSEALRSEDQTGSTHPQFIEDDSDSARPLDFTTSRRQLVAMRVASLDDTT